MKFGFLSAILIVLMSRPNSDSCCGLSGHGVRANTLTYSRTATMNSRPYVPFGISPFPEEISCSMRLSSASSWSRRFSSSSASFSALSLASSSGDFSVEDSASASVGDASSQGLSFSSNLSSSASSFDSSFRRVGVILVDAAQETADSAAPLGGDSIAGLLFAEDSVGDDGIGVSTWASLSGLEIVLVNL